MAVDTPARIAILGAGPIGIEAALYARYLGYDVDVYEQGQPAANVRRWGHVRMFSPFGMNRSVLGLAALKAQEDGYQPPADDALLTGAEWVERYVDPLANTDLVSDCLRLQTTVLAVGKTWLHKIDLPGSEDRGDELFRLIVRDAAGQERAESADVVIDATGVYSNPNWLGQGGLPALGELAAQPHIEYGVPDVLGAARSQYAGKRTLVAGSGYSAATTVVALAQLGAEEKNTAVVWITRPSRSANGPIPLIPEDRLPERQRVAESANHLAFGGNPQVQRLAGAGVSEIHYNRDAKQFQVRLDFYDDDPEYAPEQTFDCVISNGGYRPDNRLYAELQVHECYASGGPMKLAATLLGQTSVDCLDAASPGPQALRNPEPNFYILGAKSYGRNSRFLYQIGLEQIRELFTMIGDREGLNLYESAKNLL